MGEEPKAGSPYIGTEKQPLYAHGSKERDTVYPRRSLAEVSCHQV